MGPSGTHGILATNILAFIGVLWPLWCFSQIESIPPLASTSLVFTLAYLSASARLHDARTRELLFALFIGLLSLLYSLHFLILAAGVRNYDGLNEFQKADAYRMDQGGVPTLLSLSLVTPLLAAPAAGSQIHRMNHLASVNLVLYGITVALISSNAGSLNDGLESSCLGLDHKQPVNVPSLSLVLINDVIAGLALFAALFFSCLPAVQAGEGYVGLLRAGRAADSLLNHMIKNSVSGACALIEIELTDRCDSCAQRSGLR
eukprot:CAMPEP_0171763560 /NCGR_PEP_ID=MMETSP0991-20121206/49398_1 /TAXON_ID=483369 /ORGANISM="non described non described, Strain CCMP2098" /LENGTH=259 /DNA_ID=CAMNT_0012367385 /DNA_START=385 /DNA_END=1161 /DNA_ORIENTATION=-